MTKIFPESFLRVGHLEVNEVKDIAEDRRCRGERFSKGDGF